MAEWTKKNALTVAIILLSWAFTIGYVKANTETRLERIEETRLERIEQDVSELNSVSRRLELNVIKLETIVSRLEKMVADR
jgi:hypothetical protein